MQEGTLKQEVAKDPELIYIANAVYIKMKRNRSNDNNPSLASRKIVRVLAHYKHVVNDLLLRILF